MRTSWRASFVLVGVACQETAGNEDDVEAQEEELEDAVNVTFVGCNETEPWSAGDILLPSGTWCYELEFDTTIFESLYAINVTGIDSIAIVTQHYPTEFESTTHYLIAHDGTEIEPIHEWPEDHDDHEDKKVSQPAPLRLPVNRQPSTSEGPHPA